MSSSLRNSLHRRNHKERSQLSHRAKFGFLEKHKDYVLRAKDYHSKQERIQRLKQKAADRNKDEFYFSMTKQRTKDGVHVQDRGNVAMPVDMVKILKTQDENYVRTMRSTNLKKIEKIKAQLTTLADLLVPQGNEDNGEEKLDEEEIDILRQAGIFNAGNVTKKGRIPSKKHLIFAESKEEAESYLKSTGGPTRVGDRSETVNDDQEDVGLGWKKPKDKKGKGKAKVSEEEAKRNATEMRDEAKDHRTRLLKELSARLKRDTQLRYAERELLMQRMLMGKGGSKKLRDIEKVEGDDGEDEDDEDAMDSGKVRRQSGKDSEKTYKPRVYKWRAERKR